jgi:6-pyruvoyltetrahydropterin/6-carboxytetrahydropterin synthase
VRLAPGTQAALDGVGNMVEEFGEAKRMWHRWIDDAVDHSFQLSERDPLVEYFLENERAALPHLLITPGDPTTECLAACFMEKISAFLRFQKSQLDCVSVRISETPTNSVTLHATEKSLLPEVAYTPWWRRADMSINDLGDSALTALRTESGEAQRAR